MQKVDGRFGMLRQKLYLCSKILTAKQNTHYQHEKEEPLTFTQLATACSLLQ